MAGVKITDLTPLTTAASDDLLYIVDVSDTSESPQGTSKQIEVGNLLDFESGSWIPTLVAGAGAIQSPTLTSAFYSRVGNIVTCSILIDASADFSTLDQGEIQFTPPIATTSLNSIGCISISLGKVLNGQVINNKLGFYSDDTSINTSVSITAIFQYEIN